MKLFRSKIDGFFITFIGVAVGVIAAASFWPLFLEDGMRFKVIMILSLTFLSGAGLILWTAFSVKYVFYENYLYVKGGPFRSRIAYKDVTRVTPSRDVFTGYRVLSSRDGLELFYTTGLMGSVKISPEDQGEFLKELQKHAPNVRIDAAPNS